MARLSVDVPSRVDGYCAAGIAWTPAVDFGPRILRGMGELFRSPHLVLWSITI
ncbi:MAG: hypothetical protein ABSB42_16875 [Tepidisphaeraceae bacterium]